MAVDAVKRSPMPPRKAPMARGQGLARTGGPARTEWKRNPDAGGLRRGGPLRPRSDRAVAERDAAEPIVQAVYARDGRVCLLAPDRPHVAAIGAGPCYGRPLTPHHLRKAGQQGEWSRENIVTLCSGHNGGWVERERPLAHAVGLVVNRGETAADAWVRLRAAGLVTYGP